MIAKGLDFPNVTLVGVLNADTSLNLPDFRSAERTFQLLTQVAGRAGRADKEGRLLFRPITLVIMPFVLLSNRIMRDSMPMRWGFAVSWPTRHIFIR